MTNLNVEIVSPKGVIFDGKCYLVTVPTITGMIGVMYGHELIASKLKSGTISLIDSHDKEIKSIDIESGFVEVSSSDRLTILIES